MFFVGSLVGVTSHTTPLPAREGLGEGPPPHGLEQCAKRVCWFCEFCERKTSPTNLKDVLFLTEYTEEQNTQRPTETLSQPISQNLTAIFGSNALWTLYAGGVLWDRNVGWKGSVRSVSSVREKDLYEECKQSSRGNLTYYAPPCGGGVGGGATILWARNVRQKVLLNLWVLWEKKLPSELFVCYLIEWVRSISHRKTQKNRTHSISQRH